MTAILSFFDFFLSLSDLSHMQSPSQYESRIYSPWILNDGVLTLIYFFSVGLEMSPLYCVTDVPWQFVMCWFVDSIANKK